MLITILYVCNSLAVPTPEAPLQPQTPTTHPPRLPPVPPRTTPKTTLKPRVHTTAVPVVITSTVAKPRQRTTKPPVRSTTPLPKPTSPQPEKPKILKATTETPVTSAGKLPT